MQLRALPGVASLALLVTVAGCGRQAPTDAQAEEYKAKAEPIIKALEAHFAKHGTYPVSVEEIGLQHFETPFGPSRYEVLMGGQVCQLMIGSPNTSSAFVMGVTR